MPVFNNWGVSYSVIRFFERSLNGHNKIDSFERREDIHFVIKHINGITLHVLLVDEYSLGLAAVLRARAEFPEIDYVVTGGNWNGYTPEAKDYGWNNGIGVFNVGEFLGALSWTDPKKYYRKDDEGHPVYSYKNP